MKARHFRHEFVRTIPDALDGDTLYVSIEYSTAVHLCACGCGREVVTPLSPTDWSLTFDGVAVSLDPSVGNWSFPCRSHYWISRGSIRWAAEWTEDRIEVGREWDRIRKDAYYEPAISEKTGWVARLRRRVWHRFSGAG